MSDFFSRLAERTLGVEPVARPDLAPMVSSVGDKEGAPLFALENTISASARRRDESGSPVVERRAESLPAQPANDPTMFRREHGDRDHRAVPSRSEFFAPDPQTHAQVSESSTQREVSVAAEKSFERSTPTEVNSAPIEFPRPAVRYETVVSPMPQRLVQGEAPQLERVTPAPPTIHVSIGRIDVRAVTPAPARASATERRPTRLSLEQYLRERNEGRR